MAGTMAGFRAFLVAAMMVVCAELAVAVIEPLGLHNVRLSDFSLSARYERMVAQYLLETLADTDRLLLTYRLNAGLPTNDAEPYWGSWEAPDVEIRGKFMGHYLTSLSQAWASTGNPAFRERLLVMVSELSRVQAALGGGYLSAFPEEHFDRLEALEPVWAPYYAIHKIIAGLVDSYELAGVEEALPMALKAVAYHWNRTQAVIAKYGITRWYDILDVEFGGMNEILYRIYGITKDKTHLEFAKLFDKPVFRKPLEVGTDILAGLHANTHLQQVNGFAMAYDIVGDVAARNATRNFFDIIVNGHSYATGGSSVYEGWFPPYQVSDAIWSERNALMTEETCTQYNILKVSRALFRWTGNVSYADFYERALLNGILGTARVPDPAEGGAFHHHDHSHSHHGHGQDHLHLSDFLSSSGSAAAASARQRAAQHTQHAARRALAESRSGRGQGLSSSGASRIASGAAREGAQQGQARPHVVAPQRRERPGADLADDRHPALGRFQDLPPGSNATNDPGPGVFLYLLPLGSGQSKADNGHHWGYPLNSFWCCYGTAVESYTKLADSIFFKDLHPSSGPAESHGASAAAGSTGVALPPRLYVNQFVSSRAAFQEAGLVVTMDADMYSKGPAGPAASARIKFEALKASSGFTEDPMARPQPQACHSKPGSGAGPHGACTFTLMLRIPSWVAPPPAAPTNETVIVVSVNGQPWTNCPKEAKPGSYCEITRDWAPGDVVYARLPMRWWLNELPENRAQFKGLQAVMMGPFLMAGITHAERQLTLPAPPPKPKPGPAPPVDPSAILAANTWPVDESVNRLSLQASWDADLHVRLDKHLLFMAELVDAGDKMDATFRAVKPCHKALLPAAETAGAGAGAVEGGAAGGAAELRRSLLEGGQADAAIALESMSYPDHYMTYDRSNKIVFAPVSSFAPGGCDPVSLWIIRPGLDGSSDTVSFESVGRPGWFVSAEACPCLAGCADEGPAELCTPGVCERDAHAARVSCRGTCGLCLPACSALSLSQRSSPSAASFRLTSPARRAYPDGSYVLAGDNRHYLLAPLGNIVDERYTAYFDLGRK